MTAGPLAAGLLAATLLLAGLAAPVRGFGQDLPAGSREATAPPAEASPQADQPLKVIPDSYSDAVGTWDLSLQGSNKRCTLVLSSENSSNGRILRFPAGCRRALPVLARTAGWIFADGGIRLIDKDIRPLLQFSASADRSSLTAKAEGGADYALVPLQTMAMLPPPPDAAEPAASPVDPATRSAAMPAAPPAATASADAATVAAHAPEAPASAIRTSTREIPGSQPVLPSGTLVASPGAMAAAQRKPASEQAPAPSAAPSAQAAADAAPTPGVYALDRFRDRDVCRLELEPSRVGAKDRNDKDRNGKGGTDMVSAARILPGCRDSGIAVFDPVSWRYANGHMTLKAKRGHAVNLVPAGEGSWRRDPDVGTTFVLRKVER